MIFNIWFGNTLRFTHGLTVRPIVIVYGNELIFIQSLTNNFIKNILNNSLLFNQVFDANKVLNLTLENTLNISTDFRKQPFLIAINQNFNIWQDFQAYKNLNNILIINQLFIPLMSKNLFSRLNFTQLLSFNISRREILQQSFILNSTFTAYLVSSKFIGSAIENTPLLGRNDCV